MKYKADIMPHSHRGQTGTGSGWDKHRHMGASSRSEWKSHSWPDLISQHTILVLNDYNTQTSELSKAYIVNKGKSSFPTAFLYMW